MPDLPDCVWRAGLSVLAPAGAASRLSVLIFHRVLAAHDPLRPDEPTAEEFEMQLRWVKGRFNVLPLWEAVCRLRQGTLPQRPLAITFDDGYADNHDIALPLLQKAGLPATFFVSTGFLDGGRMFNDSVVEAIRQASGSVLDLQDIGGGALELGNDAQRRAGIGAVLERVKYLSPESRERVVEAVARAARATLPHHLMMTSTQVAALHAAGMEIGGHTVNHPILREVPIAVAREEIERGRQRLEEITGTRVRLFAYPNGRPNRDYMAAHASLVRDIGFDAAVSTAWGAAHRDSDPFQLPRFTPWDRRSWRYTLRLARNLRAAMHVAEPSVATVFQPQ